MSLHDATVCSVCNSIYYHHPFVERQLVYLNLYLSKSASKAPAELVNASPQMEGCHFRRGKISAGTNLRSNPRLIFQALLLPQLPCHTLLQGHKLKQKQNAALAAGVIIRHPGCRPGRDSNAHVRKAGLQLQKLIHSFCPKNSVKDTRHTLQSVKKSAPATQLVIIWQGLLRARCDPFGGSCSSQQGYRAAFHLKHTMLLL